MKKLNPNTAKRRAEVISRITKEVNQTIGTALEMHFSVEETPSKEKNEIFIKGMLYSLLLLGKITAEEADAIFPSVDY